MLNDKKVSFWIIIILVMIGLVASARLLTKPKTPHGSQEKMPVVGSYKFKELLYSHPASSKYPLEGTGYFYGVGERDFMIVEESSGQVEEGISDIQWIEQEISDDQWEAMFESFIPGPDISLLKSDAKIMYIISDQYRLFKMGGEIWLAEMNKVSYEAIQKDVVWGLYALEPVVLSEKEQPQTDNFGPTKPQVPIWQPAQQLGTDMTSLDYASDDLVIFHDYFGLYVYDLHKEAIIRRIDLAAIKCAATQGDDYCEVSVSMDGDRVQLHRYSNKDTYIYTVSTHELEKVAYEEMDKPFRERFVFIEDVHLKLEDAHGMGNYSYNLVDFGNDEYGYLQSKEWTVGTLEYVRGQKRYGLFDNEDMVISTIKELSPTNIVISYRNPTDKEVLYGNEYVLEIYTDGHWLEVPFKPNVGWTDIGKILGRHESVDEALDLELMHGPLHRGRNYRLLRSMRMAEEDITVMTDIIIE